MNKTLAIGRSKDIYIAHALRQHITHTQKFVYIDIDWSVIRWCSDLIAQNIDDYMIIDLSNTSYIPTYNPLEHMSSNQLIGIFVWLFGAEVFGPRVQEYLRNAVNLMHGSPQDYILAQIPLLFIDSSFRDSVISASTDAIAVKRFTTIYANMAQREKDEMISYFGAKFSVFLSDDKLRYIFGWLQSSVSLTKAIESQQNIIILMWSDLWSENTKFLSAFIIANIQHITWYTLIINNLSSYHSSIKTLIEWPQDGIYWLTYLDQINHKESIIWCCNSFAVCDIWHIDAEFLNFASMSGNEGDRIRSSQTSVNWYYDIDTWSYAQFDTPIAHDEKYQIIMDINALKYGIEKSILDMEIRHTLQI